MGNYGIDISHWQGTVDWNKVKTQNISYVILKLSQATSKDSNFETYYNNASTTYPIGCYIYNKVTNVATAKSEAEYAVKALNGRKMSCGVWLDMEDATMKGLGKVALTNIIETEATILKNAGYTVGIYCNLDWYKNVLDSTNLAKKYPFWIARYPSGDNGTVKESLSPVAYNGVKMWQYSSKGYVQGINGFVDMDLAFTDLVALMSTVPAPTPTPDPSTSIAYTKTQFIKDVQKAIGVAVDGIAGSKTFAATVTVSKTVNNKHAVVLPLQKYLNSLGYNCGTPDGVAGAKFDIALKQYQSQWMSKPDGEATAKGTTWKKLLGLA